MDENETLLLRRKFFYSDQNVDSRDPVQLNLLYVQVCGGGRDGRTGDPLAKAPAGLVKGSLTLVDLASHTSAHHGKPWPVGVKPWTVGPNPKKVDSCKVRLSRLLKGKGVSLQNLGSWNWVF